ncbi:hypothetical protein NT90_12005 [Acinetobacter baumannii]|nr:hypothetical protein NT90_12005 [Acinetobacter baumannii]
MVIIFTLLILAILISIVVIKTRKSLPGSAAITSDFIEPQIEKMKDPKSLVENRITFSSLVYISLISEKLTGRRIRYEELLRFLTLVFDRDTHTQVQLILKRFDTENSADDYYILQQIISKEAEIDIRRGSQEAYYLWNEASRARYNIDSVKDYLLTGETTDI